MASAPLPQPKPPFLDLDRVEAILWHMETVANALGETTDDMRNVKRWDEAAATCFTQRIDRLVDLSAFLHADLEAMIEAASRLEGANDQVLAA